jgi:hypothetical protein
MSRRRILGAVGAGVLAVATLVPNVSSAEEQGEMSLTPAEGSDGSLVTLKSVTPCPPSPDPNAEYQLNTQFLELPFIRKLPPTGGDWEVHTKLFAVAGNRDIEIPAACNVVTDGGLEPTLSYAPAHFTIVGPLESRPAPQVPATPTFTG